MIDKTQFASYGANENERNNRNHDTYTRILKEVFGQDDDTLIAHHLCFAIQDGDEFKVAEIPSADTLIFDHDIAQVIWGETYKDVLCKLAQLPKDERDAYLLKAYNCR